MAKTDVNQRFLNKAYKQWSVRLRNSDFEKIEKLRGETSRADFMKELVTQQYGVNFEPKGEFKTRKRFSIVQKALKEMKGMFSVYIKDSYDTIEEAETEYTKRTFNIDDGNIYTELWDNEEHKLIKSNEEEVRENYIIKFLRQ